MTRCCPDRDPMPKYPWILLGGGWIPEPGEAVGAETRWMNHDPLEEKMSQCKAMSKRSGKRCRKHS